MLGNYYVYDAIAPVAELLTQQLHFTDTQIGTLNAIYSLPNIVLVLVGGVLVDRYSARVMVVVTTSICLAGAVVTALGAHFPVMAPGGCCSGSARRPWWWRCWWRWRSGSRGATSRCSWHSTMSGAHRVLSRRSLPLLCQARLRAGLAGAAVARGRLRRPVLHRCPSLLLHRPPRGAARHARPATPPGAHRLEPPAALPARLLVPGGDLRGVLFGDLPVPQHLRHQVPAGSPGHVARAGEHHQQQRVPRGRLRHAVVRLSPGPRRAQRAAAVRRGGAAAGELRGARRDARSSRHLHSPARHQLRLPARGAVAHGAPLRGP